MKKPSLWFNLLASALLFAAAFCLPVDGQTIVAAADPAITAPAASATAPAPAIVAQDDANAEAAKPDPAATVVAGVAAKYPVVMSILAIVGLLRLLVKPVMSFLHARATATETKDDDERLERIERSWWMRALLFLLDWTASIKPARR